VSGVSLLRISAAYKRTVPRRFDDIMALRALDASKPEPKGL
jgi:hypothetical protein